MKAALGALAVLPVAGVLSIAVLAGASGAPVPAAASHGPSSVCPGPGGLAQYGLDSEQVNNAGIINSVGQRLGVPSYGEIIAIATALQESSLRNLSYGDRDSLGLFQQRPSQGWGTPAQVMDPVHASTSFYQRLTALPGWQQLPLTVAAQAVQRSGFPDAYAKWRPEATTLVASFDGSGGGAAPCFGQAAAA